MPETTPPPPETPAALADRLFPPLTPAQLARMAAHGRPRQVRQGEVLVEIGDDSTRFFVVVAGRVDIVRRADGAEETLVAVGPGRFTGEVSVLSGRPALVRLLVGEAGEVIEVNREHLLALVQTDSELSDILMRALILRRVELIARGAGDVVLVGSDHSPGTLRIKEFLTRNGHPYTYIDLDRENDVQVLLDRFHVSIADVPVLVCRGTRVLRNPTNQQVAECLGFNDAIDRRTCATWSSSAPDRRVWPLPCTPRLRDWTSWCWSRTRLAGRPGRARRSKTILAFRPAFPARSWPGAHTRRRRSSAPRS